MELEFFIITAIFNIYADKIVIASGGVGSLYEYHTECQNRSVLILQGICLSHNIELQDMEMMQFHAYCIC